MSGQPSTSDFQKLISQICKGYQDNYIKSPFSGELQQKLKDIIVSIQEIANDDLPTRDTELLQKFKMMKEAINAGFRAYGIKPIPADIEHVEDLRISIDAALKEKKIEVDLQKRIVLQQQQLQDAAKQENQQLRSQIQQLERELKESQAQLASLQKTTATRIASLESELQAASAKNIQLTASLENAEKRALVADEKASQAQKQARELQQKLASQEAILQQANAGNQNLKGQLLAANARAEEADSRSLQLQAQTTQLRQALESQKQTLVAGEVSNAALQSQIDSLTQQLQQTRDELQVQGESLASAKAENKTLLSTNGTLREDNTRLVSENETLKQQLKEAQSHSLASQQALRDGLGSKDENVKILESQLREAEARATAAEKQTAGLTEQLGVQEGELTGLRETNGNLQQRLGNLESRLAEQGTDLLVKAHSLEAQGVQLQDLQEKARAAREQQSIKIGQQRQQIEQLIAEVAGLKEAQGVSATDKAEFDKLQALVKKQEEQIAKLTSENTEGIQARAVLLAENAELKQRNLDLDPLNTKIGELTADNAALRAKVASLGVANQRLEAQSNERADTAEEANTRLQQQVKELTEQLAIAKLEKEELEVRNLELTTSQNGLVDGLMLTSSTQLKKIAELEKQLQSAEESNAANQKADKRKLKKAIMEINQLQQQILDLQPGNREIQLNSTQSLKQSDDPAIGIEPAKYDKVNEATLLSGEKPLNGVSTVGGILDKLKGVETLAGQQATGKESGSMLKHDYEPEDSSVKSSSYDPKNTKNKFQNDGGEKVAALLTDSKTIVLEGDPPQKMRYNKDLDKEATILAGALTLEGISESQPAGGHSVQATMEDCDDNEKFVLDVLIKFHERLNQKLNGDNPETACCTTIDYKGNNTRLREIIDSHNKAARIINSKDRRVTTKKAQSASILDQIEVVKEMASLAPQAEGLKKQESSATRKMSVG